MNGTHEKIIQDWENTTQKIQVPGTYAVWGIIHVPTSHIEKFLRVIE